MNESESEKAEVAAVEGSKNLQEQQARERAERDRMAMNSLTELVASGKNALLDLQAQENKHALQIAQLRAEVVKGLISKFFIFVMAIICIAAYSFHIGNEDLGSQIIFAVLGFVGGIGFGGIWRK